MDMEFLRLLIIQKHTGVVIELDENNRALDPIVKRVLVAEPANPAEVCLGFILADLGQFELPRPRGQIEEVLLQNAVEELFLGFREGDGGDALVGHDAVVAVRAAEVALVVLVPAARRHRGIMHLGEDARLGLELRGERLHELQTKPLLDLHDAGACVGTAVDLVGLGAGEPGGGDDLGLVEEDVQAEVVAVERPAPGPVGGGAAEEHEVVGEFVHDAGGVDQLAEKVVDAHGFDGLVVAFWRERRLEDVHDGVADGRGDFVETQAFVAEKEFGVGPCAPFRRVDVVAEGLALLVVKNGEQRLCRSDDLVDGDAFVL